MVNLLLAIFFVCLIVHQYILNFIYKYTINNGLSLL